MAGWPEPLRPAQPWWSRSRGLPAATHTSWVASMTELQGRIGTHPRLGADARWLLHRQPGPALVRQRWRLAAPWLARDPARRLERRSGRAELDRGCRTGRDRPSRTIPLTEPGRLPELFRERVAATIAVERFVPIAGERGVIVTARRDLGRDGSISWHSSLTRGLTWQTDERPRHRRTRHGGAQNGIRLPLRWLLRYVAAHPSSPL